MNLLRLSAIRMIVVFVGLSNIAGDVHGQLTDAIKVTATKPLEDHIVRESVLLPGWDPYEPVSAYVYYREGAQGLPVVIFIQGQGADKTWLADWHADLAKRGFAVISIDAHLSGDRKIATTIGGIKGEQGWV